MQKKLRLFFFNSIRKCIGIIQRILSFQKRTRTRLSYSWRPLWNGRKKFFVL
jgi:hypothetical protein